MREKKSAVAWLGAYGVTMLLVAAAGELRAVDFLRGDANSDGEVTISDSYYTLAFLFVGGQPAECVAAADVDANGRVNISDPVGLLSFLLKTGDAPAPPFPDPGPAPVPGVDCAAYGNGSPKQDPTAELLIVEAVAEGGSSLNATVTLAISSTGPIGGLSATIVDQAGVVQLGNAARVDDISGFAARSPVLAVRNTEGVLTVVYIPSLFMESAIPGGEDRPVIEIDLCLAPGTAAGEYPLTLQAGELVSGCVAPNCDADTGRAIKPALVSGMLVVQSAIDADASCDRRDPPGLETDPPPPPPPPPPPRPDVEFAGEVRIASAEARRGESVQLPLVINANAGVQAFQFSVDFDEEVLQATGIEERFIDPDSSSFPFWKSGFNNHNDMPGSAGVDEGYLWGGAVLDLHTGNAILPADTDNQPVVFHFQVSPDTTSTSTTVRFMNGARWEPGSPELDNNLTMFGTAIKPDEIDSIIMIDGVLNILPDVSAFFLRGDVNGDGAINITDPQFTLGYLFRSTATPPCLDAADANDDGKLNVTDPIAVLLMLFRGQSALPEPFDAPGADPTEDALGCREGIR